MENRCLGRRLLALFKFWQGQNSSQSVLGSDFLIPCVEEACESLRDRPIKPGLGRGFSFE